MTALDVREHGLRPAPQGAGNGHETLATARHGGSQRTRARESYEPAWTVLGDDNSPATAEQISAIARLLLSVDAAETKEGAEPAKRRAAAVPLAVV